MRPVGHRSRGRRFREASSLYTPGLKMFAIVESLERPPEPGRLREEVGRIGRHIRPVGHERETGAGKLEAEPVGH